jgi:hypothetical protein
VQEIFGEIEDDEVCDIGNELRVTDNFNVNLPNIALTSELEWSVLQITQCKVKKPWHIAEVTQLLPEKVCTLATDGVRRITEQLLNMADKRESKIIHLTEKFTLMMLVVDAYYGALYNVIDMANAMTSQEEVEHNLSASSWMVAAVLLVFMIFLGRSVLKARSSKRTISRMHRVHCEPASKNDQEHCANGFRWDANCPRNLPCMACPRHSRYSYAPPRHGPMRVHSYINGCQPCDNQDNRYRCQPGNEFDANKCMVLKDPPLCTKCSEDKPYSVDGAPCKACDKDEFHPCDRGFEFDVLQCRASGKSVCKACPPKRPYSNGRRGECQACADIKCDKNKYVDVVACNAIDRQPGKDHIAVPEVCKACPANAPYSFRGASSANDCSDCTIGRFPAARKGTYFSEELCKSRELESDGVYVDCPKDKPYSFKGGLRADCTDCKQASHKAAWWGKRGYVFSEDKCKEREEKASPLLIKCPHLTPYSDGKGGGCEACQADQFVCGPRQQYSKVRCVALEEHVCVDCLEKNQGAWEKCGDNHKFSAKLCAAQENVCGSA